MKKASAQREQEEDSYVETCISEMYQIVGREIRNEIERRLKKDRIAEIAKKVEPYFTSAAQTVNAVTEEVTKASKDRLEEARKNFIEKHEHDRGASVVWHPSGPKSDKIDDKTIANKLGKLIYEFAGSFDAPVAEPPVGEIESYANHNSVMFCVKGIIRDRPFGIPESILDEWEVRFDPREYDFQYHNDFYCFEANFGWDFSGSFDDFHRDLRYLRAGHRLLDWVQNRENHADVVTVKITNEVD
jgi:hypothetical protein